MDLCDRNDIQALLVRHGFHFAKALGQNFLIRGDVAEDIAAAGCVPGCGVLEVGPGIGALTVQLARRAEKVVSVELDKRLPPVLAETMADYDNFTLIEGDVMQLDLAAVTAEKVPGLPAVLCANLPYNITTPFLTACVRAGCFRQLTVLIQKEVALRICAKPGTADYGAFSLYCQYHATCELLFEVPPDCFLPAPKVTSAVIQLTPSATPPVPVGDEKLFFRIVKASFAMRRKTLVNGLASGFSGQLTKAEITDLLQSCGFPANIRGEQLSLSDFAQLTQAFHNAL